MKHSLAVEDVERYERDGYLFPIRILGEVEAATEMRALEALESQRAGRIPPYMNTKVHLLVPRLWKLVHDPRIVGRVQDLLGPDILCYGTSFITKPGNRDGRHVAWHQDVTYWGLSAPEAVTAWLAFTPSVRGNGCVRVLPGTHRAAVPHTDSHDCRNMLGRGEKMVDEVNEHAAIDMVLAPGEMSLHHGLAIHGSAPNQTDSRRTGFVIRYIPSHVSPAEGARNSATLVCGRNKGGFDLEQAPEGEFHPDAVARHAKVFRAGMSVIFTGKLGSTIKSTATGTD